MVIAPWYMFIFDYCEKQYVVTHALSLSLKITSSPFLAIPFYLPSSMFALKRGGKDGSATIADAFDICGFGLLAVFNGIVARVLDVSGEVGYSSAGMLLGRKRAWLPVFLWMLGGSIAAMVSLFGAVWLEGER
mmetsp:Transcript_7445/g.13555  ORF Transcript_7445/g.13555 Transcript_7445/m.13555 type:complete len:133 (-) Transcript_7445:411-809(-)